MRDDQGAQVSDVLPLGAQVSEGAHFEEAWLSNDYNFHRSRFGTRQASKALRLSVISCLCGWRCFDDMYHFVFQSESKIAVFQSDASDCVPK